MRSSLSSALVRVADAVGSANSEQDLYEAALTGLADATGVERSSILLFDADGVMRFRAWRGISAAYRAAVEGHTPWRPDSPVPDPIVVPDVFADAVFDRYAPVFKGESIRSLAFIPIVNRRRVIGKFMLYSQAPAAFSTEDLHAALAIAYQIGLAVDRRRQDAAIETALLEESTVRERLTLLTNGSQRLLTAMDPQAIVNEVVALARNVVVADGYAVWRRQGDRWRVGASAGLSDGFTSVELEHTPTTVFDAPIVAEDVRHATELDVRRKAYEREGIHSLVGVPLIVRNEAAGSIVFYYRRAHRPSEVELRVAAALGHLAAAAIINAELYHEQQLLRHSSELARRRAAFLADASALLSSLDYEHDLRQLAALVVPRLADWCAVDLLDEDDTLTRVAAAPSRVGGATLPRALEAGAKTGEAAGAVRRVLATGEPELHAANTERRVVVSLLDLDGSDEPLDVGPVSTLIVPLRAGARTFGALTFLSCAPGRHYDESDLQFATELARRAALSIENARLYQSVQHANRLKDEFTATLSHELRTPLNVILGRARMLRLKGVDIAAVADTIERNSTTLARLVDDLLDLSRITLGQMRLEPQIVKPELILDSALQAVQPAATARNVEMIVDIGAALPLVCADVTRLQQVMWNLLVNAVKFTPAAGRVAVRLTSEGAEVVLTVRDTGEGIDPGFLPHVFDMFRQEDGATSRRHGGLGLGLSIVRQLVELHGGRVAADSEGHGHGATFTVRLPVAAPADAVAPAPPSHAGA